jgi:hypothetical protein
LSKRFNEIKKKEVSIQKSTADRPDLIAAMALVDYVAQEQQKRINVCTASGLHSGFAKI